MPKFTLIAEHTNAYGKPDGTKVTYEFQVDTIEHILENVDLFIRGCGYMPPPGMLDYQVEEFSDFGGGSTNEDYAELQDDNVEWDKVQNKSKYYFDTERNK
jgi:hypothetical protein